MSEITVLEKPLSIPEAEKLLDANDRLSVVILVDLTDLLDGIDSLNELADSRILEDGTLSDIGYSIVGAVPEDKFGCSMFHGTVMLRVTAIPEFD